ncbi:MAG: helix-turn-helix domain-containing protein [Clostridiales bacterium]|nr:helix-turn-helix domain-containing protein [Clostridiales bacterium]
MDLGKKIYQLRKEKGLTLEEVGNRVGVGKSTVRKWESGQIANMRRDKIDKLAAALGVSPSYLMGWEDAPAPTEPQPMTEWDVEYPAGVALRTVERPSRPGDAAANLSELDLLRIAQRIKEINDRSLPYANLNPAEAQLVENYRLLYPKQRLKVDGYVARLLYSRDGEE